MDQLDLPFESSSASLGKAPVPLRPIHYLGSKLRMLEAIEQAIDRVDPDGGLVCDLFSGSGVVSSQLAANRTIIAVDIQEYARVLAEAVINPVRVPSEVASAMVKSPDESDFGRRLKWAMAPLLKAEAEGLQKAAQGDLDPLYDLLEAGSVVRAQIDGVSHLPQSCQAVFETVIGRLQKEGLAQSRKATAARYYGGLYFGFGQAIKMDLFLSRAERQNTQYREVLVASLLSAASEVAATVGNQFAQPLRPRKSDGSPKPNVWKRVAEARSRSVNNRALEWIDRYQKRAGLTKGGTAIKADYREFLSSFDEQVSAFYVDPPYTRDHYSRYYHVLETLCLRDNPEITKSNLNGGRLASRGLYRDGRHQSPFCIKSEATEAFKELFDLLRSFNAPAVISYSPGSQKGDSRPRVMEIEEVVRLAADEYGAVEKVELSKFSHSKLTNSEQLLDTPEKAEVLIICRP